MKDLSAKSCRSCGQWSWVCVNVFPLSLVDHVASGPEFCVSAKRHVSAKSCRSCGQWSWVCVNVFPLSLVDHVASGPEFV